MKKQKEKISVLYIDDEINALNSFKANFKNEYDIHLAQSAKEAKEMLEKKSFHIIIADQKMPDMTGIDFFESIIFHYHDPIRILMTGYNEIDVVIEAINRAHVFRYVLKTWNEKDLKMKINDAFELYQLRKQNKEEFNKLIRPS